MQHVALARKWRPKNFDDVVGQAYVLQILTHSLSKQCLHHAYLFSGSYGIGKTTLARIFAKCLNCETGITGHPCGQCNNCQAIDHGSFIDLVEIDAASRTRVEDTRELLNNVQYLPVCGRYKVYIIDEVHMLSGHSFNALLKTLEEPPAHVKFLLATTDPDKLPLTVISRCLQLQLKRLPIKLIAKQLIFIAQQEAIEVEEEAIKSLAKAANGSMRDALSLFEQAIHLNPDVVHAKDVNAMLGYVGHHVFIDLLIALQKRDAKKLWSIIEQINDNTLDFYKLIDDFLTFIHQLAWRKSWPESYQQLPGTSLLNELTKEDIQLYYQIALVGKRDLAYAPTAQIGFEMVLLRMLAFRLVDHDAVIANDSSLATQNVAKSNQQLTTASIAKQQPVNKPAVMSKADKITASWPKIIGAMNLSGLTLALAKHCALEAITDTEVILSIAPQHAILMNEQQKDKLIKAFDQYFVDQHRKKRRVSINIAKTQQQTIVTEEQQRIKEEKKKQQQMIKSNLNLQKLIQTFDATVLQDDSD